jgi:hypothetical protein
MPHRVVLHIRRFVTGFEGISSSNQRVHRSEGRLLAPVPIEQPLTLIRARVAVGIDKRACVY